LSQIGIEKNKQKQRALKALLSVYIKKQTNNVNLGSDGMEKIYNKLVRDNIINIIKSNGGTPYYRTLTDEEYYLYLLDKDSEELEELRNASGDEVKGEIADKLEILRAMADYLGFTFEEIIKEADDKKEKRGAFEKRLFLEKVEE